jgi:hypothetical protein
MSELVRLQLPTGQAVWAQVRTLQGVRDVGMADPAAVFGVEGFPETVAAVAESLRSGLRQLTPREVSVEFGIELHAKAGKIISVLAEAGGSASIKVLLTWDGASPTPESANLVESAHNYRTSPDIQPAVP